MMAIIIPEPTESTSNIDIKAIKIPQPATTSPGAQTSPEATDAAACAPITSQNDDEVIVMLAAMKTLEYERSRIEYAKLMGCRPAVLDKLVKAG
jgi:hypothetical protein